MGAGSLEQQRQPLRRRGLLMIRELDQRRIEQRGGLFTFRRVVGGLQRLESRAAGVAGIPDLATAVQLLPSAAHGGIERLVRLYIQRRQEQQHEEAQPRNAQRPTRNV